MAEFGCWYYTHRDASHSAIGGSKAEDGALFSGTESGLDSDSVAFWGEASDIVSGCGGVSIVSDLGFSPVFETGG